MKKLKLLTITFLWVPLVVLLKLALEVDSVSSKIAIVLMISAVCGVTTLLLISSTTKTRLRVIGQKYFLVDNELSRSSSENPMVLFITSNGAGMGHLTRVSAIADHLRVSDYRIVTLSSAYHKVDFSPSKMHYFPSYANLDMSTSEWNYAFAKYLEAIDLVYKPSLVVFDGTHVYNAINSVFRKRRVPIWWIQRGCWKPEVEANTIQRVNSGLFCTKVISPGDFGCEETPQIGQNVVLLKTNPIVKNVPSEPQSKEDSQIALGLDLNKKYVLIQLGAGTINSIEDVREKAIAIVRELGPEWVPVITKNPLNPDSLSLDSLVVEAYPISRYFSAFEFGIFAAGYNSVQESIEFKLPAVFIPNKHTSTDDQVRRAKGLEEKKLGYSALNELELQNAIFKLADARLRSDIKAAQKECSGATGAVEVAANIESFVSAG